MKASIVAESCGLCLVGPAGRCSDHFENATDLLKRARLDGWTYSGRQQRLDSAGRVVVEFVMHKDESPCAS